MKMTKFLLAAICFSVSIGVQAKEIKIAANNTSYSDADVQKLAATAVGMGVKEPVSLSGSNGNLTVSGSSATRCNFKVGNGAAPQIQGVSCK